MKHLSDYCIKIGDVEEEGIIEVSVSRAKKWTSCQQAHDYKYVQKLKPIKKSRALSLGSLVHECLQARDEDKDIVAVIKKFQTEQWSKLFEEEKVELGNIPQDAFRMMRAYLQYYKEVDKNFETIRCEQDFLIRIPGTKVVLVGKIDKIARNTVDGKIWCFEHKTMKKGIPTESFRMTDIQTAIYHWVLQQIAEYLGFKPEDIGGIIFDYLKTKAPTVPRVLKNGTISKAKIDTDKWTYLEAVKKAGLDPEEYMEFANSLGNGGAFIRIPMSKNDKFTHCIFSLVMRVAKQIQTISGTELATRNLSWSCDRPKCEYRDLCLAEIQGFDTTMIKQLYFTSTEEEETKDGKEDDSGE